MIAPNNHINEAERLRELESYNILDSLPESDYDDLTKLAAEICGTPIALISLVDKDRQWFKSRYGLDAPETPRELAFCAHAINDAENTLLVNDARKDERFYDNPLVTGDPNVIFYAGVPLKSEAGLPLGTLCVIDNKPNGLNKGQKESLRILSKQVMNLLVLRKKNYELNKVVDELENKNQDLEQFAHVAAHDIKSPISNISNLAGMFLASYKSQLNDDGLGLIELIIKSSDQLYKFLERLMDYSANIDTVGEEKNYISLKNFSEKISNFYSSDQNLELNFNSEIKNLNINVIVVGQILTNLIGNAIKYNDKPKAKVDVNIDENEEYYIFSVQDNGPGIEKQYQDKIFDVFVKLSKTDRFGKEGTGLGLAIVSKMVAKLGGSISIESELGNGSIFSFTILK
ncbi:MAG: histidine kinase [Winogradskyella sp.]|nr:histidine kinase [Winogradskyella sp.]|tara:strand:+ start:11564 stop:12766 length:1203 start_codon:yes stop_codon:yes gene_type:complete